MTSQKVLKFGFFLVIAALLIVSYTRPVVPNLWASIGRKFKRENANSSLLENILDANYQPKRDGNSIFFVESNKRANKTLALTSRQACSIESAAISNPEVDIFVLFSYEVGFFNKTPLPVIDSLLSYRNVRLYYFDIISFSEKTPLEAWLKAGKIFESQHLIQHVSDVLRILVLWKYSGTYFDLDVIVKKPVIERGTNFACIQSDGLINSAILNLYGTTGRSIAERNFKEVIKNFDGESWTGNGPTVLSNIVKDICNTTVPHEMRRHRCNGFEVLSTEDCYAIGYETWEKLFHEYYLDEVMHATEESFAIHFWNYLTGSTMLSKSSNAPYIVLAKTYCPRVFESSSEAF